MRNEILPRPRRAYADGPFGQVHYQVLGKGPSVFLFHQSQATSNQFDSIYRPLARQGFQVVGLDMPGFGMSDPTPSAPTIDDYAEVTPVVMQALNLDRAALLGHHTGALVATAAAVRWPERTTALIVNGPLVVNDAERLAHLETDRQRELEFTPVSGGEHLTRLFKLREDFAAGSVGPDRISEYVIQAMMGRGAFWDGHIAAYRYAFEEALGKVVVPAMILTNTGDIIYEMALRARRFRPDFEFVALDGGGVDIVDQQPETWAHAVGTFLHKHDLSAVSR